MEVNAADVKKLRDRTGMQMMKCKAALVEANGDMEKAVEILRKQNKEAQNKSAGRETAEGRIGIHIDPAKKVGAIIELRCESAPVAKNEMFVKLTDDLARQIAVQGEPRSAEEFLTQPFVDNPSQTVNDRIGELVGLMRENVKPYRMRRLEGLLGQYVHHDGTVGVLLAVEGTGADNQLLRDVCMHIAAKAPLVTFREQFAQDRLDKELEIARAQAEEEAQKEGKPKPPEMLDQIAAGKVRKWLEENVLVDQKFVKDEKKTITQLLSAAGLKIKEFTRLRVGEVSS